MEICLDNGVHFIETVLEAFFVLQDDGWHNTRCDEEIARYREGDEERALKAEHEKERLRRHREERSRLFAALRELGATPKWNAPITQLRDMLSRATQHAPTIQTAIGQKQTCNAPATQRETDLQRARNAPATANQTPIPIPQYPDTSHQETETSLRSVSERERGVMSPPSPAQTKTTCPQDFAPNAAHKGLATNQHLDLTNEVAMFVANAMSKGKLSADWDAEFVLWLRRARNFGSGKNPYPETKAKTPLSCISNPNNKDFRAGLGPQREDGSYAF